MIDEMPLDQASVEEESGETLVTRRIKNRDKHGRQQLPEQLERIEIEHDLTDDEKPCPCCGELRCRIGAETSEQLEYFPASFKVLKHLRHKYACPTCDHEGFNPNIQVADKLPQPIDKGLPGPSLLAYVITSKLGDHLPLYRLERIFERQEVHIARSTMCAWIRCAGELVAPLVELMADRVKESRVVATDDTTIPIQSPGEKQCRKGRIWCYVGDDAHPYIVYDYTPSRGRDGPASWLDGYQGYLQADAYGGYDGIYSGKSVTEVVCWAHARRKFHDAQDSDGQRAAQMLAMIGELYAIERGSKRCRRCHTSVTATSKKRSRARADQGLAGRRGPDRSSSQPDGNRDRLRTQSVDSTQRLRDARLPGYRQQRQRTRIKACRHRPQELALCRP
jgi:transposase